MGCPLWSGSATRLSDNIGRYPAVGALGRKGRSLPDPVIRGGSGKRLESTQHGHKPVHRTIPKANVRRHLARALSRPFPVKNTSLWT
jgi:hypothetical protein